MSAQARNVRFFHLSTFPLASLVLAAGRNLIFMTPTLFQALLGASFYSMPPAVRTLHALRGGGRYTGRVDVVCGQNLAARMCARIAGLPPAMQDAPLAVTFNDTANGEAWHRDFAGHAMVSQMHACGPRLLGERLGPLRFRFSLHVYDQALHWRVQRVRVLGFLPLPAGWFEQVRCRESESEGRYAFVVEAGLPLIGSLIRYEGWLEPA